MNIFITSPDPTDSAFALDDKRVIKMILESAQIMSTAIGLSGGKAPYKVTHKNHPVVVWSRQNKANYWWLFNHYKALCQVYYDRFGKRHKTLEHILTWNDGVFLLPEGELIPFVNCTPHKDKDIFDAYKLTLNEKWASDKRHPRWTNSIAPDWKV
jgi:Pyrimidine dimer DNA glycosylase